jgi:chromosome partitioning protein
MAIISVTNRKGGVGKTTAVINIATAFALKASWRNSESPGRILVIDMDPQCNSIATLKGGIFSDVNPDDLPDVELADFLALRTPELLTSAILPSHLPTRGRGNLDYIYATTQAMDDVNKMLSGGGDPDAGFRLLDVLQEIKGFYDHIFIDTSPASGWLTTNALVASTHVIVPTEPAGFSLRGIRENFLAVEKIQRRMNSDLRIVGIVPSHFHSQYGTQQDILELLNQKYTDLVLPVVSERSAVYDATQAGLDIFSYKPPRAGAELRSSDPSTVEFAAVADELERRLI